MFAVVAVPPAIGSAGFLRTHPSAALATEEHFRQVQYFDHENTSVPAVNLCFEILTMSISTRTRPVRQLRIHGAIAGSTRGFSLTLTRQSARLCRLSRSNQDGKVDPVSISNRGDVITAYHIRLTAAYGARRRVRP